MPNRIDLPRCTAMWTEQDRNLFNKLPVWMAKQQVEHLRWFGRWEKMLKVVPWQANMGNLMQGVRKERSPILRAQAFPNPMNITPKRDVLEVRELSEFGKLYKQDFESQLMHFLPSFTDFLTDHVEATNKDITEKVSVYKDLFYRTSIFHATPYIWVCGAPSGEEMQAAPFWTNGDIAESKNAGFLQAMIAKCTTTLTLPNIQKLGIVMYNDVGIPPYSGKQLPDGTDGAALKHKYLLMLASEAWDGFVFDPYLQDNRYLDLNIITECFQGSLYGRWTTMHERFELRVAADGTIPAPETLEVNPAAYNVGEVIPNPDYVNAEFAFAFAFGAEAFKAMRVGPPPADWRNMTMKQFANLDWNGKVEMTQNVHIPCLDENNARTMENNKRGEYLQLLAAISLGILPINRRYVVPILYKRQRSATV